MYYNYQELHKAVKCRARRSHGVFTLRAFVLFSHHPTHSRHNWAPSSQSLSSCQCREEQNTHALCRRNGWRCLRSPTSSSHPFPFSRLMSVVQKSHGPARLVAWGARGRRHTDSNMVLMYSASMPAVSLLSKSSLLHYFAPLLYGDSKTTVTRVPIGSPFTKNVQSGI